MPFELQVAKVEENHENHEKTQKNDFQMSVAPKPCAKPMFFIRGIDQEFYFLLRNIKIRQYNQLFVILDELL